MTRQYQRRPKRVKLATVVAAEMTGIIQASEQSGVPESTIRHWMKDPEMAEIRAKTREDLADEIKAVAHLAWEVVGKGLRSGDLEPRDAIFAAEKATSLQILMSGGATARSEVRDITGTLADSDVIDAIRAAEQATVGGGAETPDQGPPEGEAV